VRHIKGRRHAGIEEEGQRPMERNRRVAGERLMEPARKPLFDRSWLKVVVVIFVLEVALFAALSFVTLPADQANSLLNDTQGLVSQMQNDSLISKTIDIFVNNVRIALEEFVPGFGWYLFFGVTVTTGQIYSALGSSSGVPAALLLITTFLSPHSWFELAAYAVALAESFFLVNAAVRRRLRAEVPRAASAVLLVVFMLFFAAFLEAISIEYSFEGFAYAWAVVVVAAFPLYWLFRNLHRPARSPSTSQV
jgi:uncharacterized membrane protein SpoIIM required for sporulation